MKTSLLERLEVIAGEKEERNRKKLKEVRKRRKKTKSRKRTKKIRSR